ncbi:MAG: thymidine phosphorylase [Bdellovibrionales bacterium]|nr:thymidine phosphorylase [Bdellovibrionales bacterium]
MSFIPAEIIKKKRRGLVNSPEEIEFFVKSFAKNELPDYQMAAWAMAVFFQGMSTDEIAALTKTMKESGRVLDFSYLNKPRIDKHSTGGVGDKTTLILGPIAAAAGVTVPMIAGRGLGHTGGTLDKLEAIPGFQLPPNAEVFKENIERHGFALMGQTEDICPADKKLYALRDVTGTVESLPLICGSIMSKKLAEGLTGLVLDVKFGSGAFMKTLDDSRQLAKLLKETGEKNGVKVHALLTNMNQPLGSFVGNALEVHECVEILSGKQHLVNNVDLFEPCRELSLQLAGHMIYLANKSESIEGGYKLAKELLENGHGLKAFEKLCEYQGNARLNDLELDKNPLTVESPSSGYITSWQTEQIGLAALELGAGRKKATDSIEYSAGFEFLVQTQQKIEKGQPLFKIYGKKREVFNEVAQQVLQAMTISETPLDSTLPLIAETLI